MRSVTLASQSWKERVTCDSSSSWVQPAKEREGKSESTSAYKSEVPNQKGRRHNRARAAAPQAQLQSSTPRFTCTSFPGSTGTTPCVRQSSERQQDNKETTTKLSFHQLDDLDAAALGTSLPGLGSAGLLQLRPSPSFKTLICSRQELPPQHRGTITPSHRAAAFAVPIPRGGTRHVLPSP